MILIIIYKNCQKKLETQYKFYLFIYISNIYYMYLKIEKWKGRLGNNIEQVKNTILLACITNSNIILPEHKYFLNDKIIINENLDFNDKSLVLSGTGDIHKVYESKYIKLTLKKKFNIVEKMNKNQKIIRRHLRQLFKIKSNEVQKYDNKTLVIYIRSGDLFEEFVHYNYISAPLYFYEKIINDNISKYDKFILVAEDNLNPVIKKLLKKYSFIEWNKNSLDDDISIILGCSHIVSCVGTFIKSLSWISKNMEKVYLPDFIGKRMYNPQITFEKIELKGFREKIDKWENTKEQCDFLINYKPN